MGRDKALIEVDGQPLVWRVAAELDKVAEPVILATGTKGRLGDLKYAEVTDARSRAGPIGGMVAGLRASPHELTAIVAVDLPFANADVLSLLAGVIEDADAAVPVTSDGLQPLHAVYARTALPVLERALVDGPTSVRSALAMLDVREVGPDQWGAADPTGRFARNLNWPDDLAKVLSRADRDPAR